MRDLRRVLTELRSALQETPIFDPDSWVGKALARFKKGVEKQPQKPGVIPQLLPFGAPLPLPAPKKWVSAGGVVLEPGDDTKVYLVKPSGSFGPISFPKGKVDPGESLKQTAIREVWEESGLRVKIRSGNSYLGKGVGTMSVTHYWLMIRTGGSPKAHGWETEKVLYVTWEHAIALFKRAGNRRDIEIARRAMKELGYAEGPEHVLPKEPKPKKVHHEPVQGSLPLISYSKWPSAGPVPPASKGYAGLPLGGKQWIGKKPS